MSARNDILNKVKPGRPPLHPLPGLSSTAAVPAGQLAEPFQQAAVRAGAGVTAGSLAILRDEIRQGHNNGLAIADCITALPGTAPWPLQQAAAVDRLYVPALLGVAENGAVWIDDRCLPFGRLVLFAAQHLVIWLPQQQLVADMPAAMERLTGVSSGYGVFVAGPSRTADIEQALVTGAHGPLSVRIVLGQES